MKYLFDTGYWMLVKAKRISRLSGNGGRLRYNFRKWIFFFQIAICIQIVQAQTLQYNREFQVNTYINSAQMRPDIDALLEEKFVICWQSYEQDSSSWGIFAQIFDKNARKLGEEFRVNTTIENDQSNPTVCGLSNGGFVVCWDSFNQDGYWSGIFGQRFNENGTKQGEEFQVNTYTDNYQIQPIVCGLSDGGFVVCWKSLDQDGSHFGIFGQIFYSNGIKKGDEFQVNTYTDNRQDNPSVSVLSGGGFVVCWQSYGQDEQYDGIFMQLYNNDGTQIGKETQVNTFSNGFQGSPCVNEISDNRFMVCWHSDGYQDSDDNGIFGQIFDSTGTKQGNEFVINTYTIGGQFWPRISNLSDSGFVICWVSKGQDGDGSGIFAQLFNNNGTKNGKEFQINNFTERDQERPNACDLSNGNFVICYESVDQDGSSQGVIGKYYLGKPISHSLDSYSLLSPAYDATLSSIIGNFQWQVASDTHINFPWELEYKIYIDKTSDFNDPEKYSGINDTTYSVGELTPGNTYFWKVLAKNSEGDSLWSSETFGFYVSAAAGIEDDLALKPETFKLNPNYPNPFNPTTVISYQLPVISNVALSIYDILGHKVTTLVNNRQNAGYHQVEWDASDFASGVYFLFLEAGSFKATQKMLLTK